MQPLKRPGGPLEENSCKRMTIERNDLFSWDENKLQTADISEIILNIFDCYKNIHVTNNKEAKKFLAKMGNLRENFLEQLALRILFKNCEEISSNFWMSPGHCHLIADLSKLDKTKGLIALNDGVTLLFNCLESSDLNTVKYALKSLARLLPANSNLMNHNTFNILVKLSQTETAEIKRLALKTISLAFSNPAYSKQQPTGELFNELLKSAESDDLEIQKYAVNALAYLSAHQAQLFESNSWLVILRVIRCHSQSPNIILNNALGMLANIEIKNSEARIFFFKNAGVELFANIASNHENLGVVSQAIRALSYMPDLVKCLSSKDDILKLVGDLKNFKILEIAITAALSEDLNLAKNGSFCFQKIFLNQFASSFLQDLIKSNPFEQLKTLANHPDAYVKKNICWTLNRLVQVYFPHFKDNVEELIYILLEFSQDPAPEIKNLAKSSLLTIFKSSQSISQECFEKIIAHFTKLISDACSHDDMEMSLRVFSDLCKNEISRNLMISNPCLSSALFAFREKLRNQQIIKNNREIDSPGLLITMDILFSELNKEIQKILNTQAKEDPQTLLSAAILAPELLKQEDIQAISDLIVNYKNAESPLALSTSSSLSSLLLALGRVYDFIQAKHAPFAKPLEFAFNGLDVCRKFPDITLVTDSGKKIPCHRVFLAGRSDYFDCLFSLGMKEQNLSEIKIMEISDDLLEIVVDCFYNRNIEVNNLSELFELLSGFNQFQMLSHLSEGLKFLSGIKLSNIPDLNHDEIKDFLDLFSHSSDPAILCWIALNWDYWVGEKEAWIYPYLDKFASLKDNHIALGGGGNGDGYPSLDFGNFGFPSLNFLQDTVGIFRN